MINSMKREEIGEELLSLVLDDEVVGNIQYTGDTVHYAMHTHMAKVNIDVLTQKCKTLIAENTVFDITYDAGVVLVQAYGDGNPISAMHIYEHDAVVSVAEGLLKRGELK